MRIFAVRKTCGISENERGIVAMNKNLYANIVNIKRFAVHDGEGIRTTAFFKGCPMRCKWCHNPETLFSRAEIGYFEKHCENCGACAAVCKRGCHTFEKCTNEGGETCVKHVFRRENCTMCGACAEACENGAIEKFGELVSAEKLCGELLRDKAFYSPGGVTLSGGECLLQSEVCAAVLAEMKKNGVNTAVDTCGNVPREAIERVLPYTDEFLYDVKQIDDGKHRAGTGCGNAQILENLRFLSVKGARTEIRYPLIPNFNDGESDIKEAAEFLKPMKNIAAIRVLPYHNLAGSKYAALGLENTLPAALPSGEDAEKARRIFRKVCKIDVK